MSCFTLDLVLDFSKGAISFSIVFDYGYSCFPPLKIYGVFECINSKNDVGISALSIGLITDFL